MDYLKQTTMNLQVLPIEIEDLVKDYYYQLVVSENKNRLLRQLKSKYNYRFSFIDDRISNRIDTETGDYVIYEIDYINNYIYSHTPHHDP